MVNAPQYTQTEDFKVFKKQVTDAVNGFSNGVQYNEGNFVPHGNNEKDVHFRLNPYHRSAELSHGKQWADLKNATAKANTMTTEWEFVLISGTDWDSDGDRTWGARLYFTAKRKGA